MSAQFASASSQTLVNNSLPLPSTGYPFTIACWGMVKDTSVNYCFISVSDNATTNNHFRLRTTTSTSFALGALAGGAEVAAIASVTITANTWYFLVGRCISATNRRISVWQPSGPPIHAQNVTSTSPTGLDNIALGSVQSSTPLQFLNGFIAEFWLTNTDIQAGGAQLQDSLLWQLAYDGPFSVPHIAKDIVEYHSLRHDLSSNTFSNDEDFLGIPGLETLTNTNGVTLGPHPPLRYQGKYNWRNTQAFDLQAIFAGMAVATTPDLFSWGITARNRLMMVGHGR